MKPDFTHRVRGDSGQMCGQWHLQEAYKDFEEFEGYSDIYGNAERLGYKSSADAWGDNPLIISGVNPGDLRKVDVGDVFDFVRRLAAKDGNLRPAVIQRLASEYLEVIGLDDEEVHHAFVTAGELADETFLFCKETEEEAAASRIAMRDHEGAAVSALFEVPRRLALDPLFWGVANDISDAAVNTIPNAEDIDED